MTDDQQVAREIMALLLRSTNGRQWKRNAAKWAVGVINEYYEQAATPRDRDGGG